MLCGRLSSSSAQNVLLSSCSSRKNQGQSDQCPDRYLSSWNDSISIVEWENKIKTIFEHKGIEDYCDLVLQGKVIQPGDYLPFIPRNLKTILGKATRVDPSRRYQTALEMRRALEGLNYPGYWTCDSEGNFLGYSGKNTYFFSSELRERGRYNFAAKKKGKSGRVVKMTKYSQKNVGLKEMVSLKQKFMLSVVTGKNPK